MKKQLSIGKVVDFVRKTHPYAGSWEYQVTCDWIGFFMLNGLIAVVSENGRTVDGLCLFRPVMTAEEGADESRMNYDPEGSVVWLDFTYYNSKRAMAGLTFCLMHRLGERKLVAWSRCCAADRKLPEKMQRRNLVVVTVEQFKSRALEKDIYGATKTSKA